jgi:hypothetical protein
LEAKYRDSWPFEQPFYILLNLAIGGYWPGNPDNTTIFPSSLDVDYVRVYDITEGSFARINGTTIVRTGERGVEYCLEGDGASRYTGLVWRTPKLSSFTRDSQKPNCISVIFGKLSGYVTVVADSDCGAEEFKIPVMVQKYYHKEFSLLSPDMKDDKASLLSATGEYDFGSDQAGRAAIKYTRNIEQLYDYIILDTSSLTNLDSYVSSAKKFFMDLFPTTSAPCTEVILQLEDSSIATPDNYPTGRHSRYRAFITSDGSGWERLEFAFKDRPDTSVTKADHIVLLLDPELYRGDVYYIGNLDSTYGDTSAAKPYEPLPTNKCRVKGKSEKGACTDGVNNDSFGYDGDGETDCADRACWDDPACTMQASGSAADCSMHTACAALNLQGLCCPTADGSFLDCCSATAVEADVGGEFIMMGGDDSADCSQHPKCAALGLMDLCCPTADDVYLDCCESK